ncbi:uncharacterized protein LOC62_06G008809 [Vanrija pseudolonga]|uniref:Condensation domain-containing protein n=1 Tax=Vanrija pseudolonga TaxID=143232 RepID=A0AAF0YEM2_9TREE|nr:hypothetical protein LOC62_06G008809 [Vanrija pseudolonga]
MVTCFQVPVTSTYTVSQWKHAWTRLASEQAIVRTQYVDNALETTSWPLGVPDKYTERSFTDIPIEDDWTVQDGIDLCMEWSDFSRVQLAVFHHDAAARYIMITNTHVLADAGAVFRLAARLAWHAGNDSEECPTHGLNITPLQETSTPSPWRNAHLFSQTATDTILTHCRDSGFTLTSWVYAAACHAVLAANPPATWPVAFSSPVQPVSKLSASTRHPVGQAASSMAALPLAWSVERTDAVADTARRILAELKWVSAASVASQESYISTMLRVYQAQRNAKSTIAFPTVNSLGNLSPLLDAYTGVQVATRNNLPTLGVHAYTLGGCLNLSMAWCSSRFESEEIEKFWTTFLRLVVEIK